MGGIGAPNRPIESKNQTKFVHVEYGKAIGRTKVWDREPELVEESEETLRRAKQEIEQLLCRNS